ncbi:hypothetical protein ACQKCU_02025 [Heyndrickxia sporothermodurans]
MNKSFQLYGIILFLSGIFLFGIMHLAIALYIPHLGGWSDPPGKLATVLEEISGRVPYLLSIAFMIIGGIFIIYGLWKESGNKE